MKQTLRQMFEGIGEEEKGKAPRRNSWSKHEIQLSNGMLAEHSICGA